MSRISQKIKLALFRLLKKQYKRRLFSDNYDSTELKLVALLLKQQTLSFIDVGANKGEFIYAAEKSISPIKITAFEPLPYFSKKLKALFPGIAVFNIALSDTESQNTLYVPVKNGIPDDSLSSLSKPENGDFETYSISCKTLDTALKEYKSEKPCFLKIDVECHEFKVLKGGEKFIGQHVQVMLIEIEERHHSGKALAEMINEVESLGFICYYLHPQKQQLVGFTDKPDIFQKKEDLNTPFYINNFWFFAKQIDAQSVVSTLNQNIF